MSLLQAILALPTGPQKFREFYHNNFPTWSSTLLELSQIGPLAEFLESTLFSVIEDPVEDEIKQWHKLLFENMRQNCSNVLYLECQQMTCRPLEWYTAFQSCLNQELQFVNEEWLNVAKSGLQICYSSFQQIQYEAKEINGFAEMIGFPTEQNLLEQLTDLVETTSKCVLALLEYKTNYRPSYFSSMSSEFPNWRVEYRARLESIQRIRIFMQSFFEKQFDQAVNLFSLNFSHQIGRMRQLFEKVNAGMRKLISQALIITEQPQRTIKQNTKFDLGVKIICIDLFDANKMTGAVSKTVINDCLVEGLHRDGLENGIPNRCGKIVDPKSPKCIEADKTNAYTFKGLRIPRRPQGASGSNNVLKQKFVILFHAELQFDGVPIRVWACSSPFVYTTNVSQDCDAAASLFWGVYVLYKSPLNVTNDGEAKVWQVRAALSRYIKKETNISWEINHRCLDFLMEKILGCSIENFSPDDPVDRAEIDVNIDPDSGVTFWKWFMAALKLLKEDLSVYWRDGYIVGFIDRDLAEDIINEKSLETFLVRFSGSEVGGLTFTSKGKDGTSSTILPKNTRGQFIADVNHLISDSQDILQLLYIDSEGEFEQIDKNEVFVPTSTPPASPEKRVNPRRPYDKLKTTFKTQTGSMLHWFQMLR